MSAGPQTPPAVTLHPAGGPHYRKVGLLSLVFVMYAYNTGGPYGTEGMVNSSGPGMSLLYFLILPLFWAIPISFVAAELTTAMPVEGGFYRWVRAAFGDFWGFQAGWWNWTASFLVMSSYAVLFADYVSFYYPGIAGWRHYLLSAVLLSLIAYVNIRGIRLVGLTSTLFAIVVMLPVAAMCIASLPQWSHNPFFPLVPPHRPLFKVFGVGLALGLWGYSGYEQASSCAEEVENPQRNYPLALALVTPLSIATYFIPAYCSLAALGNWENWNFHYYVDAGQALGGAWLGISMLISAAVCSVSLLNATVLTGTRIPFAMADDGYLPRGLKRTHKKFGTPWVSIVVSTLIAAIFAVQTLGQLITLYIWLRIGVTLLTVLAAWRLRITQPDLPRTFHIPWGRAGLIYAVAAPALMSIVSLLGSDPFALKWGPLAVALGPIAYLFVRRRLPARA